MTLPRAVKDYLRDARRYLDEAERLAAQPSGDHYMDAVTVAAILSSASFQVQLAYRSMKLEAAAHDPLARLQREART